MGRGRPKGSKAKPKILSETASDIKIFKKQIKDLRAEKLSLPSGSERRIELHREIKRLKELLQEKKEFKETKLIEIAENNLDKDPIIAEILGLDKVMASIDIDLRKHTVMDLQKYLNKLKGV